jgi:hypothetical protein
VTYYLCVPTLILGLECDHYPTEAEVWAEALKRLTPSSPNYGLHISQMAWIGTAPVTPVVPPVVPPTPTGKQWRVIVSASLWTMPSRSSAFIGYAAVGDILTQVDDAQPPDWLHTTRGWLHSNQVVAA